MARRPTDKAMAGWPGSQSMAAGKELIKATVPLLTSSEIKSHYGR